MAKRNRTDHGGITKTLRPGYWRGRALSDLSEAEWEGLCDGCGLCCLIKLEDEDSGALAYTDIHCRLYDAETRRCGNYALRSTLVKGCVRLTPETIDQDKHWMPRTCAYRLLAEGEDLPDWHPLLTGDPASVARARVPVASPVPEWEVDEDDYEDRILERTI